MFGRQGSVPGELGRPMHMDIREDKLYVAEYLNDRVQIFSLSGTSLQLIGSSGSGPGQFDAPDGVADFIIREFSCWPRTALLSGNTAKPVLSVSGRDILTIPPMSPC